MIQRAQVFPADCTIHVTLVSKERISPKTLNSLAFVENQDRLVQVAIQSLYIYQSLLTIHMRSISQHQTARTISVFSRP